MCNPCLSASKNSGTSDTYLIEIDIFNKKMKLVHFLKHARGAGLKKLAAETRV